MGLRAGGRVPGPEPGAVRGHRPATAGHGPASPWATTNSHLLLDRRRSRDPGALPDRLPHRRRRSSWTSIAAAPGRSSRPPGSWSPTTPACSRSGSRPIANPSTASPRRCFPTRSAEADWLLDDLLRDQAASGLAWGEYGVLYRYHTTGQALEARLIGAGIPCLMARGQALMDDALIGYVVLSLRILHAPDDPLVVEAFAERMLPRPLLDRVHANFPRHGVPQGVADLLADLPRRSRRPAGMALHLPHRKSRGAGANARRPSVRWWTHCPLSTSARTAIRSTSARRSSAIPRKYPARRTWPSGSPKPGPRPCRLDRARPRRRPRAASDARVRSSATACHRLEPGDRPAAGDFVLRAGSARPLLLFKALQLLQCRGLADPLQDYVAFDLETTEKDAGRVRRSSSWRRCGSEAG